jgi:hypothetical protein
MKGREDRLGGRRNIETSCHHANGISYGGEEQPGSGPMPTNKKYV